VPGAWLAGFIFALHPVCVEGVAWISEQKSTLSGFFYLAAALAYLNFDRARKRPQYFIASGLFLLALMSKTVTATLPVALLIVFWWQRGKLGWRDIRPLLPWIVTGAAAGLFTAWVESSPQLVGASGPQYAITFAQRLLVAGRVPWFYAWKALLPVNLMFTYPHWKIDPADAAQYLFPSALLGLAAALVWLAFRPRNPHRAPLAGFLFFMVTLAPVLGFLNVYPFRYSWVADHFQYLALLGIVVPVTAGLNLLARKFSIHRMAALALCAVLVATLGAAASRQSGNYRDYETLFRATLARNPGSSFVHSNLGVVLMGGDREAEAASEFQTAVQLTPGDPDYRVNLGLALSHLRGRMNDAIAEYRKALELDPHAAAAHLNLGLAYTSMPGRLPEAIEEYRKAIRDYATAVREEPDFWEAHLNLGMAYAQMPGREADAIAEYRAAIRMKPESALAHFQLGNTFHKMKRLDDAIGEYQAAAGIDPYAPEVHYELAYALAQVPGRLSEAIAECQTMLQLKPGDQAGEELMRSLLAFQQAQARR
jgi:tetratricopeptide (TPR) repeat protein